MKCYVLRQLRLQMALGTWKKGEERGERSEWERVSKVVLGDIQSSYPHLCSVDLLHVG